MRHQEAINLLTINEDVDEANRLVNLLRNADLRVDPHYVASPAELAAKLATRNWDLALVRFDSGSASAKTVLQQTRRLGKDLPVVLTISSCDNNQVVEGLKLGAADVVSADDESHLILVTRRILRDLDNRRQLRYWQRRFVESETRFENLLGSSQDGIAIIQEGMFVLVNDVFAHLYGYQECQQLELMPVFDSLAKSGQQLLRAYLKPLDPRNAFEACSLSYEGTAADGSNFPVQAECSQINFRGEPALQLLVPKAFISRGNEAVGTDGTIFTHPGDIRVTEAMAMVDAAIRLAVRGGADALLWYLKVDGHQQLQRELGISLVEEGTRQLAMHIADTLAADAQLSRIREDAFICVVPGQQGEVGIAQAAALVANVGKEIFETEEGSFSCTLSIGIVPITEMATCVDTSLDACQRAIDQLHVEQPEGGGVCLGVASEHRVDAVFNEDDIELLCRQLLDSNRFETLFQPVVPLHGHPEQFYSTLVKVRSDGSSLAVPEDLLSSVRKAPIGLELDCRMLHEASAHLVTKKISSPSTRLFFELGDASWADENFPRWFKALITEQGLASEDVVLQIRETSIGRQLGRVSTLTEQFRRAGFRISLSHFGLAANPVATLNKLKVDFVRLDGMLVEKASQDTEELDALLALIALVRELGSQVIVPDVASTAVIPALWQARVDFVTGACVRDAGFDMDFDFDE